MPSIKVYAELLLHLRQVTAYVSLDSNINDQTSLDLSTDLQNLNIHHGGETACLQLPAKVAANTALELPSGPVNELSYRFPILGHGLPANLTDATANNAVPWSAESLRSGTGVECRNCNQTLVERSAVAVWKNLPSENWAEMMDFWHCHKPDHEEHGSKHDSSGGTTGAQKGYTADNKLLAKSGVGFVDLSQFLLAKENCSGIEHSHCVHREEGNKKEACPRAQHRFHGLVTDTASQYQHSNAGDSFQVYPLHFFDLSDGLLLEYAVARISNLAVFAVHQDNKLRTSSKLRCEACHAALGFVDEKADGWRLWKWSLCVQLDTQSDEQTFPTEMFVSTQLLELIENQAVRKFVIHNEDGEDGVAGMMLWVFTPDLRYSACTEALSKHPKRAMKILYQQIENASYLSDKQYISLEELQLPAHILEWIWTCLEESTALLPLSARKFQNWDVGLLARFDSRS